MKQSTISRRMFLGKGTCGAMSSLALFNTLLQLRMTGNAMAQSGAGDDDHKALVCIFLFGGNDSFNMLVPTTTDEYSAYAASRSNLALPSPGNTGGVLPLTSLNTPGRTFGLNPAMPKLQSLFNTSEAAFVANVGTLVVPIPTPVDYKSGNFELPKALFSHNNQQAEWQTSLPQTLSALSGWAGRMADATNIRNDPNGTVPMSISLDGNNIMQTGSNVFPYSITKDGSVGLTGSGFGGSNGLRVGATESMMEETYRTVLERAYAEESSRSFDTHSSFASATSSVNISTAFDSTTLSQNLAMVARSIAAGPALGHKRQIFFVGYGSFDHHDELLAAQTLRLTELDNAISSFQTAMSDLSLEDQVTLFTCSEFSRTIRSNGRGTDHAWGGNQIVVGGAVKGSRIYGQYPDTLGLASGMDIGTNGRLLPSTSCDLYFAELAKWFGVSNSDLETILPNISEFYSPTSSTPPLGFLL
ncbi:MAG: DUF1501 domain-containing protein [Roseibacillus sp.]